MKQEEIHKTVREQYGKIAKQSGSCCGESAQQITNCCGANTGAVAGISKKLGYSDQDLNMVPESANLGLGCGNPVALASLKKGEIVLDLGSGAGFDSFLAAAKVGTAGKVIGIDMTAEMLDKARENARKGNYTNVEFRLGEIENLPVADNFADVVISNCVINLASNKQRVFDEAFRVLKPGGRLMVSDLVILKELPSCILTSIDAYIGCVAGAMEKNEYMETIGKAGFEAVKIIEESAYPLSSAMTDIISKVTADGLGLTDQQVQDASESIASIKVQGIKPAPETKSISGMN
ncbi:MAG: arsenite methyltransferase [Dehalococcoidia bacterium]|nr:arsenite methyltransferase [Dehalococcoidia bacterium]